MFEMEASSEKLRTRTTQEKEEVEREEIVEVDLTFDDNEASPEVIMILPSRTVGHLSKKIEFKLSKLLSAKGVLNMSRLFIKSVLAKLISDVWMEN